jgi:gliding motility-associated lipoprotein GldH
MAIRQVRIPVFLFLAAVVLFSCNHDRLFEKNVRITNGSWASHNNIPFSVVIEDTNTRYDFYVNIRNDVSYPYSNLFLFLKTTFPDKRVASDTVECLLASYDGRWLGSGMGSVRFSRFLFQQGVKFQKTGTYLFEFQQAMRVDPLPGIRDIGIRIEKQPVSYR